VNNLNKILVIALALAQHGASAQTAAKAPLAFPSQVTAELVPTNAVQILNFTGTNLTDHAVKILGYSASCGCTTLDSRGESIPAGGTMQYRVKIAKARATVEYAEITDEKTNVYQVVFRVKAKGPATSANKDSLNTKQSQ